MAMRCKHEFAFDENGDVICRRCDLRGRNGSPEHYSLAVDWALAEINKEWALKRMAEQA